MTIELEILTQARTMMAELSWVKKVNSEKLLLDISELREHEFPIIQIISLGKTMAPVQRRHEVQWTIAFSAAMRKTQEDQVDNVLLETRESEMRLKIGENTQFNTTTPNTSIIQWQVVQSDPIVHVTDPYQIIQVTSIITYETPFSGDC